MFTFQRKCRPAVIRRSEIAHTPKRFLGVTSTAVSAKDLLVHIFMTGCTVAHISHDKILEHTVCRNFRVVTIRARDRRVLPFQRKPCFIVIEVFHATEEVEGFFDMTFLAVCTEPATVRIGMAA